MPPPIDPILLSSEDNNPISLSSEEDNLISFSLAEDNLISFSSEEENLISFPLVSLLFYYTYTSEFLMLISLECYI